MGSKSGNYDIDMSNEDSSKNDTSLIVNVNDTQSDIDDHDESNYSDNENDESPKKDTSATKRSRSDDSKRRFDLFYNIFTNI